MVPPVVPDWAPPAFTATLVSVRLAPLANTATLDTGAALGGLVLTPTAVNTKSSNVTPFVSVPVTSSANPAAVGATVVGVDALYAHEVQLNPPYTVTPSSAATTASGAVNVPHAYTRFVPLAACPIA
jgi:hypothetical protein